MVWKQRVLPLTLCNSDTHNYSRCNEFLSYMHSFDLCQNSFQISQDPFPFWDEFHLASRTERTAQQQVDYVICFIILVSSSTDLREQWWDWEQSEQRFPVPQTVPSSPHLWRLVSLPLGLPALSSFPLPPSEFLPLKLPGLLIIKNFGWAFLLSIMHEHQWTWFWCLNRY